MRFVKKINLFFYDDVNNSKGIPFQNFKISPNKWEIFNTFQFFSEIIPSLYKLKLLVFQKNSLTVCVFFLASIVLLLKSCTAPFLKMFCLKHKSPYSTDFYLLIQSDNKIKVRGRVQKFPAWPTF